ncbi:MAG: hypothetical protein HY979_01460 [Candidatus Magasanikbacteria bacterium]|nr:hypothetical protein [Candidatus Magasanikbacteria bacterium]
MSEQNRGLKFEKINYNNDLPIKEISRDFLSKDYITAESLKKYAQEIARKINSVQSPGEQRIVLIDLLSDNLVLNFIEKSTKLSDFSPEENEDIKKMSLDAVNLIKKRIIFELKPLIDDDLYLFVKKEFEKIEGHFNEKILLTGGDSKTKFLKSTFLEHGGAETIRQSLQKLTTAFAKLKDPENEMPFVQKPVIIDAPVFERGKVTHTSVGKDLITIEEIFEQIYNPDQNKEAVCEALLAIVDCLRGAKFLADNGLTLTDISTITTGKNLGMDNKTKKGILFDLDGLRETDEPILSLVGPQGRNKDLAEYFPPEYRKLITKNLPITARAESMIWEFGHEIVELAIGQKQKLLMQPKNKEAKKLWSSLIEFANKMMAEKANDRPDFDTCIKELEKIVSEYLPVEKK